MEERSRGSSSKKSNTEGKQKAKPLSKRAKILIIVAVVLVVALFISLTVFLVVINDKDKLSDLYQHKSVQLESADYGGYIYDEPQDIAQQLKELDISNYTGGINAVLRVSSVMAGIEFDTLKASKSFVSGYAYTLRHKNIVFFSDSKYMSGLLFGTVSVNSSGTVFKSAEGQKVLLKAVTNSVSEIDIVGYRAFANCEYENVNISSQVTGIDSQAFLGSSHLKTITLEAENNLKFIGKRAFENCTALTTLSALNVTEVGDFAFGTCGELKTLQLGRLDVLGDGAFYGCDKMDMPILENGNVYADENILYADGGKTIAKSFDLKLKKFTVPQNVDKIGFGAFERLLNLESVTLGEGVTNIGQRAFENCIKLTAINLQNITDIGDAGFLNTKLQSAQLDSIVSIGADAFRQTQLSTVILPVCISQVGDRAFEDNSRLRKISIMADTPFKMGDEVFNGIYRLFVKDVGVFGEAWQQYINEIYSIDEIIKDFSYKQVSDGLEVVQYLGEDVVVIIPDVVNGKKVVGLGDRSFSQLGFIQSVTAIGNNLRYIGTSAFDGCAALQKVIFNEGLQKIGNNSLRSCGKLDEINMPNSLIEIGMFALDGSAWVNSKSGEIIIGGGVLYRYKGDASNLTLSSAVKYVGDRAFIGNTTLETLVLPNGVLKIYDYALSGCTKLYDIRLPNSLLHIGVNSISGCPSLKTLTLPPNMEYMAYGSFFKPFLESITVTNEKPFNIGTDVFAWPQGKVFKIYVPKQALCSSKTGECTHEQGKTYCYKHASKWTAYKKYMEAIV